MGSALVGHGDAKGCQHSVNGQARGTMTDMARVIIHCPASVAHASWRPDSPLHCLEFLFPKSKTPTAAQ
eukprot:8497585-Pyramimonas_sp.AAC.1